MTPNLLRYLAFGFLFSLWAALEFFGKATPDLVQAIKEALGALAVMHLTLVDPKESAEKSGVPFRASAAPSPTPNGDARS